MTLFTERTKNTNDTATVTAIVLNSSTSILIAAVNPDRVFFHVNNGVEPDKACWIKLHAAGVDNTKHGIVVHEGQKGTGDWEMPPDNIYTGDPGAKITGAAPPFNVGAGYFPIVFQWKVGASRSALRADSAPEDGSLIPPVPA